MVVLPQPLSPTSPSVSPFFNVKLTPSTALTSATFRRNSPRVTGKYIFSSWMSRMLPFCCWFTDFLLRVRVAPDVVARVDRFQVRPLLFVALLYLVRAPGEECAGTWHVAQVGGQPVDGHELSALLLVEAGDAFQKSDG